MRLVLFIAICIVNTTRANNQPNILLILTDDQRADSISAFNQLMYGTKESPLGHVSSPNVDQLAKEGTAFLNTHCQSAACAPSRASMHFGQYPHHTGVYGFEPHHSVDPNLTKPTIPVVLAEAGYQTSVVGKLGQRNMGYNGKGFDWSVNQYEQYVAPFKVLAKNGLADWRAETVYTENWVSTGRRETFTLENGETVEYITPNKGKRTEEDEKERSMMIEKYDFFYPYLLNGKASNELLGGISPRTDGKTRDGFYVEALKLFLDNPDQEYETPWEINYKGPDKERPQFINLGFDFPHTPLLPPKSFRDKFAKYTYNVPEFDNKELEGFPPQLLKLYKQKQTSHFTAEEKQQIIRDYYAFCAYGDTLVGEAVRLFKEFSKKNNKEWMIVYVCGDHGMRLNDHGSWSKFGPWAIDTHNPIIVVSSDKKAFPAGKVVKDFTEFVDIAPTIYSAAGLNTEEEKFSYLDGYDLAKVASGEKEARDYILTQGWWVTGPRATIRTKDFLFSMKTKDNMIPGKDMEWPLKRSLEEVEPVLYDLRQDPLETNNVAGEKRYQAVANAMREKLQNIVLGDRHLEVKWNEGPKGKGYRLNFAEGSDDKKLNLEGLLN